MFCKNCGKELPEESSFCPYCMTKFTKETPVEPISNKKSFNKKPVIIAVAVIVAIALAVSGIFIAQKFNNEKTPDSPGKPKTTTASEIKKPSGKVKSPADDTSLGLSLLQSHSTASDLGDTEKLLLDYFGGDYFDLTYDSLKTKHKYYKNAKVRFTGSVKKVIKKSGHNYTLLIEYGTEQGFDGIMYYTGDYATVECTFTEFKILPGQILRLFGIFKGLETNSLNGEKVDIPSFTATNVRNYNFLDTAKYSKDELMAVAEYIFGKGTTLRTCSNEDFEFLRDDFYDDISTRYFVSELFHLGSKDFQKFAFYNNPGGFLIDCKTEIDVTRLFTVSADFEHYYVTTNYLNTNSLIFECYNKSFEKIWSREFTDSAYFAGDSTENYIYLSIGEKLYILDAKTGKDAIEPKTVGEKIDIRKLTDGILLISSNAQNAIVKLDLEGNELWKISSGIEAYTSHVQIIGDKYVIQKGIFDELDLPMEVITTIVTPEGEMIANTTEY